MGGIPTSLPGRLILALTIGLAIVGIDSGVAALVLQQPLNLREEAGILAFQILLASIPFLLLALAGIGNKVPWLVGVALTALFWGLLLTDAISRDGDGSGANIGLALLLLFSPLIISIACFAVARKPENPVQ